MPLIDGVVRRDVVDLRRARFLRRGGIGHRRQHLVIDFDFLRRIARLRQRLRNHHRHRIADMVSFAAGERRMRRHFHRRAVLGMDHPAADQIADLVGSKLGAGQDRDNAGRGGGRLGVDRFDFRVRVRGTEKVGVGLPGPVDVVGIVALAGDETLIFLAAHRNADTGSAHGFALRQLTPRTGHRPSAIFPSACLPIRRLSTLHRRRASRAHRRRSLSRYYDNRCSGRYCLRVPRGWCGLRARYPCAAPCRPRS